jgi:hypothetical protein
MAEIDSDDCVLNGVIIHKFFMKEFVAVSMDHFGISEKKRLKYCQSDKVILPRNTLETFVQCSKNNIYMLKLNNPKFHKIIYCGICDFDAPDHVAILPDWIMTSLNLESGDKVFADAVTLSKATEIKVRCPQNICDPKSVLEFLLKNHTVLYKTKKIKTTMFGTEYIFDVLDTKPHMAVNIIGADVVLHIEQNG